MDDRNGLLTFDIFPHWFEVYFVWWAGLASSCGLDWKRDQALKWKWMVETVNADTAGIKTTLAP